MTHDCSQVSAVLVRHPQLPFVAGTGGEDLLDAGEFLGAFELDRDLGEVIQNVAEVLTNWRECSVPVDDDLGIQSVPGRPPLVLAEEPGLDAGQFFPGVESP